MFTFLYHFSIHLMVFLLVSDQFCWFWGLLGKSRNPRCQTKMAAAQKWWRNSHVMWRHQPICGRQRKQFPTFCLSSKSRHNFNALEVLKVGGGGGGGGGPCHHNLTFFVYCIYLHLPHCLSRTFPAFAISNTVFLPPKNENNLAQSFAFTRLPLTTRVHEFMSSVTMVAIAFVLDYTTGNVQSGVSSN